MSDRRLPVYILLDTSGSMRGEAIHSVNVGMRAMLSALRKDPYALESAHLCIITFDLEAKVYLPLTPLHEVQFTDLAVPESGATFMGAALQLLVACMDKDVKKSTRDMKGDWRPLLFLMTDGKPSDVYDFRQTIPEVKKRNFGHIVACGVGPYAKEEYLRELTDNVETMATMDEASFLRFFQMLSASVAAGSGGAGATGQASLPPPPPEVQLVP
ncbi:MAG TPA: VWA domain-containing protein [Nitrospira sp.]|nr:VWA domain-containing protein [Nitrospira sp.]HNG03764.1 VWA domain-containing protein [Nitrospira sp.]HNN42746.1 VWA domain-containing protein [Nitrospira sp.]HNO34809.1 VWA domain-containing protein [Nitrospira sp.]